MKKPQKNCKYVDRSAFANVKAKGKWAELKLVSFDRHELSCVQCTYQVPISHN